MSYFKFDLKKLHDRNFLITGGAGFIGSHIADYLLNNGASQVTVLDNLSTGSQSNILHLKENHRFQFVNGDINDLSVLEELCSRVDFVVHQAALGSVPRSIREPLATHHSNATGFLSVLEACRKTNVKRLVFASSSSVYGDSEELPKKEDRIGFPKSPYAITKLMDEYYAGLYAKMHQLEVIGLRYFNIFGPRQNPNGPYAAAIPLFILSALKGESPIVFGDGEQSRDFTFVMNAVQANVCAMLSESDTTGEVYNIACGREYTLNQVIEIISENLDVRLEPVYRETRVGDIKHSLASIDKARRIGFEPDVELREGLDQTIAWYKGQMTQNSSSSTIGQ